MQVHLPICKVTGHSNSKGPKPLIEDEPPMGLGALSKPEPSTILISWLPLSWPLSSFLVSVEGKVLQGHPRFVIAKQIGDLALL